MIKFMLSALVAVSFSAFAAEHEAESAPKMDAPAEAPSMKTTEKTSKKTDAHGNKKVKHEKSTEKSM